MFPLFIRRRERVERRESDRLAGKPLKARAFFFLARARETAVPNRVVKPLPHFLDQVSCYGLFKEERCWLAGLLAFRLDGSFAAVCTYRANVLLICTLCN